MFFLIFINLFYFTLSFCQIPCTLGVLPDYEIPKWVYNDVFSQNKNSTIDSYKKNNIKSKKYLNEFNMQYDMMKILNLPFGLMQNPNNHLI
tara:strand:+ start:42 stop:314 length:273 start_codon:yes stop_codon:yes gene_type:complete